MPKRTKSVSEDAISVEPPLTQSVEAPSHEHAKFEYEYGEMRRCHLCGPVEAHIGHDAEQVWFADLESRARHILEIHRDCPVDVQRAKEILAIADLWDSKSPAQPATFKVPIIGVEVPIPQLKGKEKPQASDGEEEPKSWLRRHPLVTLIGLGVVMYGLYTLYLMVFQGYTF